MMLAIMVLFTSVDVSVFAREGEESEVVETAVVPESEIEDDEIVGTELDITTAGCELGICNNGLGGIWIDINSEPYSVMNWNNYAYTKYGCAWFASARAREITNKKTGTTVYDGESWWNNGAGLYGLSTGQELRAPALACWSGHVAVIEKIEGDTVYRSEGGASGYSAYGGNDEAYGYTIIRAVSKSEANKSNGDTFKGYVYLSDDNEEIKSAPTTSNISVDKNFYEIGEEIVFNFSSDYGTEYYIYISDAKDWSVVARGSNEGNCYSSSKTFSISTLPVGKYYAYVTSKNSLGHLDSSRVCIKVYDSGPKESYISVAKEYYKIGEEIVFNFSSDYGTEYYIYISDGKDWSVVARGSNEGNCYSSSDRFNISTLPAGKYYAYVVSRNSLGHLDSGRVCVYVDGNMPEISDVQIVDVDSKGYTLKCTVIDDLGIDKVYGFAWTGNNGQDDYPQAPIEMKNNGNDYYLRVNDEEHNYERGRYLHDIVANDLAGNKSVIYSEPKYDFQNLYEVIASQTNGHRYELYDDILTWEEAKAKCEELGGHLVTITSQEEQDLLIELMSEGGREHYQIGGYLQNGSMSWVTGEAFDYTNWDNGEPNNYEGHENVCMMYKNGRWNDTSNDDIGHGFICEYDTVTYTINFNPNSTEATGSMSAQAVETGSSALLNQNQFVRTGYTFTGWNTKADGSGTAYADKAAVAALATGSETQITLYAQWEKTQQVKAPVANIASGSVMEEGTRITLSSDTTGAEIYYTTDGSVPTKVSSRYTQPITMNQTMTIKAIAVKDGYLDSEVATFTYTLAQKVIYTITFDKNGSDVTGTMAAQVVEKGSNGVLNSNQYMRNGYTFTGWNTKADGSGRVYADRAGIAALVSGTENAITLYAQWEQIPQVSAPTASIVSGSVVEEGAKVALSCTESGAEIYYTTDGSVPTKESIRYTTPITVNGDITIKAMVYKDGYQASEVAIFTYRLKEKTIYTITFDKNGSDVTGTMTAQAFEEGSPVLLNQNSFSQRGYTFAGWNTKADGTGTAYADRTGVGHIDFGNETAITLYAQWEQILKVATPTADIASGSVVEAGTRVTLSCADEGVEIHYTTDNSIPTMDSPVYTTPIVIGEDMTIKAVAFREGFESSDVLELSYTIAEENSVYTIQFHKNSNQATGEMASQTLEKDGVLFLNGNSFLWEEYYFTGWNTKADGSGTAYKNYDLLFGSDMGSEKVITLYAQWRKMDKLEAVSASVKNQSTVRKGTEVALEHSLDNVQILYTTDGTMPTEESATYMAPFVITEDIRIMAIAVKEGYMPSEPVEFTYKVAETGEILEEDIPAGGLEEVPEGLWIAGIHPEGYTYTAKAIKPEVRVYDHTTLLEEKKDYTISYSKNINASENGNAKKTPTITVKGKGNYTGKDTAVFKINPKSIVSEGILAQDVSTAYNKKTQKPVPTVYDNGKKLKHKKDYTLEYVGLTSEPGAFQEPGSYKILIHGTGNYSGTRVVEFVITDTNLISKASVSKIKNQPYNEGNEVRPEITVKYKGQELVENSDYTVTYLNNTKVGKATVVIRGVNAFSGVKYVNFNITAVSLKGAEINGIYNEEYTGKEIKHEYVTVRLYSVNKILTEGKDYVVSYQNNVKVGKATVTFTGINGYTGTVKKTFKITPYNIWQGKIKVYMDTVAEYVKGGTKPEVVILFDNRKLKENVDYKLTYKHNQVVADDETYEWDTPEVIITGKGNFEDQLNRRYSIIRKDISGLEASIQDPVYKNKANAWKVVPKLFDVNGKALKAGTDYEKTMVYSYAKATTLENGTIREAGEEIGAKDIVPAGTLLNVTITGKGKYKGELTAEYRVVQQSVAKAKVKIPTQVYTGKEIKLDKNTISVTCGKQKLEASDYEIISYQNNVQKGTAKVTIKGVGNYGGTKTVAFKIKSKTFLWWK